MKWKISKIEIQSFKAFEKISFDFEKASLLTLDGPNGYGKTTIFDAIELLLTGKIGRTFRLFSNIMPAGKRNYDDNLYWNRKQKEQNLYIKAEFTNSETGKNKTLARMAKKTDLSDVKTNRADNFDAFLLYELSNFESTDFSEEANEHIINELFGESFSENYPLLNYLEQGQNSFLFSKKIDKRKEALEQLINTAEINAHIEKYTKIEQRINKNLLSKEKESLITTLTTQVDQIQGQISGSDQQELYHQLTTKSPLINWDQNPPFKTHDPELLNVFISDISNLKNLIDKKSEISSRLKNQKIENYLNAKENLIVLTAKIGHHIHSYSSLDATHTTLTTLKKHEAILSKDSKTISIEDITPLLIDNPYNLPIDITSTIATRDDLIKQSTGTSLAISDLSITKNTLIETYKKLHTLDGHCPLCGNDWVSEKKLMDAIEERHNLETKNLNKIGIQLDENIKQLSTTFLLAKSTITQNITDNAKLFDEQLYKTLIENKEHFSAIETLSKHLEKINISYPTAFTTLDIEIRQRVEKIISAIRDTKDSEVGELPADWELMINRLFEKPEDFQKLTTNDAAKKIRFIQMSHSLIQSETLKTLTKNLASLKAEKASAQKLKATINKLKTELTKLEKKYAGQTISDIELTFHIYSGRLIQNYQRGLGLFIERGDGSHLRFSTAEHSEHDALLSMSSGQISALSLAFFFSLNRVYSRNSLILIDDPAQSLDEINIASLSDLLRCELKDRQIIVSSHEDDISSYLRYRFSRAGLSQKGIHMQKHLNTKN